MRLHGILASLILGTCLSSPALVHARPSGSYSKAMSSSSSYTKHASSPTPAPIKVNRQSSGYGSSNKVHANDNGYKLTKSQKIAAAVASGSALTAYETSQHAQASTPVASSDSNTPVSPSTPKPSVADNTKYHYNNDNDTGDTNDSMPKYHHYNDNDSHHDDNGFQNGFLAGTLASVANNHPNIQINNTSPVVNSAPEPAHVPAPVTTPVTGAVTSTGTSVSVPSHSNTSGSHVFMFVFGIFVFFLIIGLAIMLMLKKMKEKVVPTVEKKYASGIRGFSNLRLGNSITIPAMQTTTDPSVTDDNNKLHFEPAVKGETPIVAIGELDNGQIDIFTTPDGSQEDFIRISIKANAIVEATFFSLIDTVEPASAEEWGDWLDDENGNIGQPTFITKDGVEWTRVLFSDNAERVKPNIVRSHIHTHDENGDNIERVLYAETLYVRNTNYMAGFPQQEYLLVREHKTGNQAYIEISAGTSLDPATLNFSL